MIEAQAMKALLVYRCRFCGDVFETDLARKLNRGLTNAEILGEDYASEIPRNPAVASHSHACDLRGNIGFAEIVGVKITDEP